MDGPDLSTDDGRFAAAVKELRERLGWSQAKLAEALKGKGLDGFHPTTVARLESGSRRVSLGEARAISQVLGAPVSAMVAPGPAPVVLADFNTELLAAIGARESLSSATIMFEIAKTNLKAALELAAPFAEKDDWLDGKVMSDSLASMLVTAAQELEWEPQSVVEDALAEYYNRSEQAEEDDEERVFLDDAAVEAAFRRAVFALVSLLDALRYPDGDGEVLYPISPAVIDRSSPARALELATRIVEADTDIDIQLAASAYLDQLDEIERGK